MSGSDRVNRGGSWNNNANNLQVGNVNSNNPSNANNNIGFRFLSTGAPARSRLSTDKRPGKAQVPLLFPASTLRWAK